MKCRLLFTMLFLGFTVCAHVESLTNYPLTHDPIDVVIVTHPKDKKTLDDCIDGLKKNCNEIGRVIVVSAVKLTDKAEWFNENQFPFNKEDVALAIVRGDKTKLSKFFHRSHRSPGWYYQQLLKLYSPFMISNISPNVLIIDSDTIFMNHVEFLNESNGALFCPSPKEGYSSYFEHAQRLVPGYERVYSDVYSVCHHMIFQKPILDDLFQTVEAHHGVPFWVAFCSCVDLKSNRGASEFEIYYNFALRNTEQVRLRELKWAESSHLSKKHDFQRKGYHFVSFHTYLRNTLTMPKSRGLRPR